MADDTNYELSRLREVMASLNATLASATLASTGGGASVYIQAGWSPVLVLAQSGLYYYLQVSDWVGGVGTKPVIGQYLTLGGWTNNIASATVVGIVGGALVTSVNTYTGAVTLTAADVGATTAAAVAAAYVSLTGSYANPSWLTSVAWSKLTSVPAAVSSLSGTNTGDQTITLTGDVTGTGTGSFATTLANSGVSAGTYGSATAIPALTIDAKGRITGATTFALSTLPDQTGNSGKFLTTNGSTASWATVSIAGSALTGSSLASGITSSSLTSFGSAPTLAGAVTFDGFVVSTSTYSSQTYARIIATSATDVNVVLATKGAGSLSARMPDGTGTNGNQLGQYALDLQLGPQLNALYVASGNRSVALGYCARASGYGDFAFGNNVQGTVASGGDSLAMLNSANASGGSSICLGSGSASANWARNFGHSGTASGQFAVNTGYNTIASLTGQQTHGSGAFAAAGDCQVSRMMARRATSDATPANLFLDGSSARLTVNANTTGRVTIRMVCRSATAGGHWATGDRVISWNRGVAAGTTSISTPETIGTDRGSNAGAWPAGLALSITADTTNGAIDIQFTGLAATNLRTGASILDFTEVTFA